MFEPVPLNPDLYTALKRRFKYVKIANENLRLITTMSPNMFDTSKLEEKDIQSGEYYRVCCPYCRDSRYRLYVHHRYNTLGSDGQTYGRHRVLCHNERCDMSQFENELKPYMHGKPYGYVAPETPLADTRALKEVTLPGTCVPILSLPSGHPALNYLAVVRKFDIQELAHAWNVHYCVQHDNHLIKGRIIVPVYWDGKLVGWQARAVGEGKPKYYTMPGLPKQIMLFNGDRAKKFKVGIVAEGVFDVFRIGLCGVALLGKSLSYMQTLLAKDYWGEGGMGLALDSDALDDMRNTASTLQPASFKRGLFEVRFPEGAEKVDPAALDRNQLWGYIYHYASQQGITKADFE